MSDLTLLVSTFADETTASRALATLAPGLGAASMGMSAVVVKLDNGKVKFVETDDQTAGQGFLSGAGVGAIGGLFGILFTPLAILSIPVGGAVGALVGKLRDSGFDDTELKGLGEDLAPGQSALVTQVRTDLVDKAQRLLAEVGVLRTVVATIGADLAAVLDAEAGDLQIAKDAD
jgi:uncharacterized membrane protein